MGCSFDAGMARLCCLCGLLGYGAGACLDGLLGEVRNGR